MATSDEIPIVNFFDFFKKDSPIMALAKIVIGIKKNINNIGSVGNKITTGRMAIRLNKNNFCLLDIIIH